MRNKYASCFAGNKTQQAVNRFLFFSTTLIAVTFQGVAGQDFYDITQIHDLEIFFADSNWDYLLDSLYAVGNEERLVGTILIDGVRFDSVGVRYKGQSSYHPDYIKNPLNIKLDYIKENQLLENRIGTLKLANVTKDPSFVREVLSYEIGRKYMTAGKANYAFVFINGSPIGLYTSVQDVDRFFMIDHFTCVDKSRFKGVLGTNPQPVVWGYLGPDSSAYYDNYEIESEHGWNELIEFLDVYNNDSSNMEQVLSIDAHLWMLAFDILMVNLDSPINMAQNFYLFKDASSRFHPIIWDLNENFGAFREVVGGPPLNVIQMQRLDPFFNSDNPNYPIINKMFTDATYEKMYVAHMKTMIEENFTNGWYVTRALELQDIIDSLVQADPNKFYTYSDFLNNIYNSVGSGPQAIVGITELMDARANYLTSHSAFQGTPPVITNIGYTPSTIHPNTTIWFAVTVDSADLVMLGFRQDHAAKFMKMPMFDDGYHNDGAAGDGLYGISVHTGSGNIEYYIYAENDAGIFSPTRAEHEFYTIPVAGGNYIALESGYPNPFKDRTTLTYHIPVRSMVDLAIFDVTGRKIRVLINEEKDAGSYAITYFTDGINDALPAGVYLAKLTLRPTGAAWPDRYKGTAKLVLLK